MALAFLIHILSRAKKWRLKVEFFDKINSVLDRNEWHMSPQTVNAYFSPTQNEIVFPAAILQPPFYHRAADTVDFDVEGEEATTKGTSDLKLAVAANFGGIGAVIAHEITHGYDDQGRKFDGDGNMNDWWTEDDTVLFKTKTDLMVGYGNLDIIFDHVSRISQRCTTPYAQCDLPYLVPRLSEAEWCLRSDVVPDSRLQADHRLPLRRYRGW